MKLFSLTIFVVIANVIAKCPYGGENLQKIGNGFEDGINIYPYDYWKVAENAGELRERIELNYLA